MGKFKEAYIVVMKSVDISLLYQNPRKQVSDLYKTLDSSLTVHEYTEPGCIDEFLWSYDIGYSKESIRSDLNKYSIGGKTVTFLKKHMGNTIQNIVLSPDSNPAKMMDQIDYIKKGEGLQSVDLLILTKRGLKRTNLFELLKSEYKGDNSFINFYVYPVRFFVGKEDELEEVV